MVDQRSESEQRRTAELLAAIADVRENAHRLADRLAAGLGSGDAARNTAPQDLGGIAAGEAPKRRAAVATDVSWPRQW